MQQEKIQPASRRGIWAIAITIFASCLLLFSLDSDTHGLSDLFALENLIAWAIYFTPTFIICRLLYKLFLKKNSINDSIILSLIVGIPLTFMLIIALLFAMKRWTS